MSKPDAVGAAGAHPFRIVGYRRVAETGFLTLDRLHVAGPGGHGVRRETVRHPGAVAVVPVVGDDVVLIRQYRAPVDAAVLEIPAGKLDRGDAESVEECAHRELAEEVGLAAGNLEQLASFYTGPGFTDERITVFLATGCTPVPFEPDGPEEEQAEIVRVPLNELAALVDSGAVTDAKSLVGLLAFLRRG